MGLSKLINSIKFDILQDLYSSERFEWLQETTRVKKNNLFLKRESSIEKYQGAARFR